MKHETPAFLKKAFTCPHCDVYASFVWKMAKDTGVSRYEVSNLHIAHCSHCKGQVVWFNNDHNNYMLWPFGMANAPLPHEDMPEDVKTDYLEARHICLLSPRGAAALLRLSIQKLCKHLGEPGKDINTDIGALVKKGLPAKIQQALDIVRVTGNNAVHPGEIIIDDNPEVVSALFGLINLIIDNRIAEPKKIESLYNALPERALRGIEERDGRPIKPPSLQEKSKRPVNPATVT